MVNRMYYQGTKSGKSVSTFKKWFLTGSFDFSRKRLNFSCDFVSLKLNIIFVSQRSFPTICNMLQTIVSN